MRPVASLPTLRISLAGRGLADTEVTALASLRVRQRLSRPAQAVLAFRSLSRRSPLLGLAQPGTALVVAVAGAGEAVFEGEVTAVEHAYLPDRSTELRIRGYDALHRLRLRQQVRSFEQVDVADVARALVADLGISVDAPSSAAWPRLHQHRQSDLELLRQSAEQAGLHFVLEGSTLRFLSLAGHGDPITVELGGNLLEASIEINAEAGLQRVEAHGWITSTSQDVDSSATDRRARAGVTAEADPTAVGGTGERLLVGEVVPSADHLAALAQGELDARVAREVTARLVVDGDPGIRPGRRVDVQGVDPSAVGTYTVAESVHLVDAAGYVTTVSTEPPPPAARADGTVATLAEVTDVEDPDRCGRVCLRLGAFAEDDLFWAPVVLAGVGKGKGLAALPDVGDTVLVLLLQGDPGQAVVLGGLVGEEPPDDLGIDGGRASRFVLGTAAGQRLVLDGSGARTARLENVNGSHLELEPDLVRLRACSDLVIEAPGQRITFRAQAIDFEEAT